MSTELLFNVPLILKVRDIIFFRGKTISLPFCLISLWSENVGNFRFFFVSFSLRFIFVLLQISMFRIDAKQAKKHFFSYRSKKYFASILLHFATKRKWRRTLVKSKPREGVTLSAFILRSVSMVANSSNYCIVIYCIGLIFKKKSIDLICGTCRERTNEREDLLGSDHLIEMKWKSQ